MLQCNCQCIDSADSLSWACPNTLLLNPWTAAVKKQTEIKNSFKTGLRVLPVPPQAGERGARAAPATSQPDVPQGWGCCRPGLRTPAAPTPNTEWYQARQVGQLLRFNPTHLIIFRSRKKEFAAGRALDLRGKCGFRSGDQTQGLLLGFCSGSRHLVLTVRTLIKSVSWKDVVKLWKPTIWPLS